LWNVTLYWRSFAIGSTVSRWAGLAFVVQVVRERTIETTGKKSIEIAYYIGSDTTATVQSIAQTIRRHWAIENQQHWVLDIAFRENEARHRAKNVATNFPFSVAWRCTSPITTQIERSVSPRAVGEQDGIAPTCSPSSPVRQPIMATKRNELDTN